MLDGVGWEFVPWFVVYAPSPSIDASASATTEMEMPMVSSVYISAPAPASDADVDTATAGHLLALGLQQFRVEPRRRLFMVSVVPILSFRRCAWLSCCPRQREEVREAPHRIVWPERERKIVRRG